MWWEVLEKTLGKEGSFCGNSPCSCSWRWCWDGISSGWEVKVWGPAGDSTSPQLGAQSWAFFSSSSVEECASLSSSSCSSSPRLINPDSRHAVKGGWAGWEPLPLCSWDFLCEVFLMNCAGIPSWRERALCWCQPRSEQWLCHPESWWLRCSSNTRGVANCVFCWVWKGN